MGQKHSVFLQEDKCEGCTNCVKNCPTKAIRVHGGKATIIEDLCIDCGQCIRTCEYDAKYTETNSLTDIKEFSYPVALIPPSFFGQFQDNIDLQSIISGLYSLGFAEVYNVSLAAEAVSYRTLKFLNENDGFYISSSCPVVVRLIKLVFPELMEHLIPFKSPVELMAHHVRDKLNRKDLGIFFMTPCPAKFTTVNNPMGVKRSYLDGAIAVDKVYARLISIINNLNSDINNRNDGKIPYLGVGWGQTGGEINILKKYGRDDIFAVSGIKNVYSVLEEIARDSISGIRYFELAACPEGCAGGILNVKSPYQTAFNLKKLARKTETIIEQDYSQYDYSIEVEYEGDNVTSLDKNLSKALEKLERLEAEEKELPGLDCAACGAPDCRTLAEDIVNGLGKRTDCIFMLRKEVGELADKLSSLTHVLPPVMGDDKNES